jgi:hypothetical protein
MLLYLTIAAYASFTGKQYTLRDNLASIIQYNIHGLLQNFM